ncbi:MAG TPA: UPF0175 family protein [Thermoanaerobaculia bacterium]|nr:UPF0175 family protein [Thermoanaerobaculia bacterium]
MIHITLEVPDEILLSLRLSQEGLGELVLMAAAAKLFEIGKLSSGAAAQLAGVPRPVFLSRLADYGVNTFNLTEQDFLKETRL